MGCGLGDTVNPPERVKYGVDGVGCVAPAELPLEGEGFPDALRAGHHVSRIGLEAPLVKPLTVPVGDHGLHDLPHGGVLVKGPEVRENEDEALLLQDGYAELPEYFLQRLMKLHHLSRGDFP